MNLFSKLGLIAALAAGAAFAQANAAESSARISVDFGDPDAFTDIEMGAITTEKDKQYLMGKVRSAFNEQAGRYLPAGYTLFVKVTDIDLAGDQDPMYSIDQDIRIMKEIYPPRMSFDYEIIDAQGSSVAKGSARLKDWNYLSNPTIRLRDGEPASYLVDLVRSWASRDLRRALAG